MPTHGYPSSSEPKPPTPQALAAGLLAATSGDYAVTELLLRQALALILNAADMRDRNHRGT